MHAPSSRAPAAFPARNTPNFENAVAKFCVENNREGSTRNGMKNASRGREILGRGSPRATGRDETRGTRVVINAEVSLPIPRSPTLDIPLERMRGLCKNVAAARSAATRPILGDTFQTRSRCEVS